MTSRAFIVATIGSSSAQAEVFADLLARGMDAARFNLSWTTPEELRTTSTMLRGVARDAGRNIPFIADLPGPRIVQGAGHTFDPAEAVPTARDMEYIKLCSELGFEYIAVSFVSNAEEIKHVRELAGPTARIIAKIERREALEQLGAIAAAADALMVARGDLGKSIPIEEVPFVQERIISAARVAGKPVITATDMLRSMTEEAEPTRAEVSDVSTAIMQGADAVMLSEETAAGKYPREAVAMMERIVLEAEKHRSVSLPIRPL